MQEYEREVELYDYIEVLLKYKWIILVATLVCGGIGWVLRPAPTPPLYEADAVLMVKNLPSTQVGQQAEIPTGTQTSGFYNSLALADDLKQALIDSLDLNMSVVAMDGILGVQVLDPGVRLTVRTHDPDLPIKLVNKWAQLFVERNGDLNGEVAETYYEWVKNQYNATRDTLIKTESAINRLSTQADIEYFQLQKATLDTMAIQLHQAMVESDSRLKQNILELEEIEYLLQTSDASLNNIDSEVQKEDLDRIRTAVDRLDSQLRIELSNYDKEHQVNRIRQTVEIAGLDSLKAGLDSLKREINIIERELMNHEPVLLGGGGSNPTYIKISDQLALMRMKYQSTKLQSRLSSTSKSPENPLIQQSIDEAFSILQYRKEIVERYQATRDRLKTQESELLAQQDNNIDHYSRYIAARDSLISENKILHLRTKSRRTRLKEIQSEISDIRNKLSDNLYQQQRLQRDQESFNHTLAEFLKTARRSAHRPRESRRRYPRLNTRATSQANPPRTRSPQSNRRRRRGFPTLVYLVLVGRIHTQSAAEAALRAKVAYKYSAFHMRSSEYLHTMPKNLVLVGWAGIMAAATKCQQKRDRAWRKAVAMLYFRTFLSTAFPAP